MTQQTQRDERLEALPAGMVDYCVRTAIRDLMRVYGKDRGREIAEEILNDEADGRRQQ